MNTRTLRRDGMPALMEVSRHGECPFGGSHTVQLTCDGRSIACRRCHKTWTPDERGDLRPTHEPAQ